MTVAAIQHALEGRPHAATAWSTRRAGAERVLLALACFTLWKWGYAEIAWRLDPARGRSLATPIDDAIPFAAATVYLYGLAFGATLFPFFVVRSRALLRRIALAYVLVITASFLCYVLFPVSAAALRPPLATLDARTFDGWCVRLLYSLDPPTNQCPSLHVSLTTLGSLGVWRASRRWGGLASPVVGLILLSVLTVKQHFVIDAVAGLFLALLVYHGIVRRFRAAPGEPLAYDDWRRSAALAAFQGGLYAAIAAAYLLSE